MSVFGRLLCAHLANEGSSNHHALDAALAQVDLKFSPSPKG